MSCASALSRFPLTLTRPLILSVVALGPFVSTGGCQVFQSSKPAPATLTPNPNAEPTEAAKQQSLTQYIAGVKAFKSGNRDEAKRQLQAATQSNPKLVMARSMLGDLYREDKQYATAAAQYELMTQLDPYSGNGFYRLGVAYHLIPQLQNAAAAYLKSITLEPKDWKSNMNLGLVYLVLGHKEDAVTYTHRATDLSPSSAIAWANLGAAYDAAGQAEPAGNAYRKAIELDPTRTATYLNLATNLLNRKEPGEASNVLASLLKRQDTPYLRTRYAQTLIAASRLDDAIQQTRYALKADPHYYPALNTQADAQLRQYAKSLRLDESKREDAINNWKQSLEVNANQPDVISSLQKWYRR